MVSFFSADKEARQNFLREAAVFKVVNRQKYLETIQEGAVEKDDVIVSLLADLQQEQDQESEKLVNDMQDKVNNFCLNKQKTNNNFITRKRLHTMLQKKINRSSIDSKK